MTKKSRQKLSLLENEKNFWGEIKSIFHNFQRTFSCQKLSQTWECAFKSPEIWLVESFFNHAQLNWLINFTLRYTAHLKILQYRWLRAFWLITQKRKFSKIWYLRWHKTNNRNIHLTANPEESTDKVFWKNFKNLVFCPFGDHFEHSSTKMNFLKKLGYVNFQILQLYTIKHKIWQKLYTISQENDELTDGQTMVIL